MVALLTTAASPSVYGQQVTFTATVQGVSGEGAVQFLVNGGNAGQPVTLDATGAATFSTANLSVGTHTIAAVYQGNNFSFSLKPLTQTVWYATTTVVTASSNRSVYGQPVTFTATVAATQPGAGTPTGTVTFSDGGTFLRAATLEAGTATFTDSSLEAGTHEVTAAYNGNGANFAPSTSSALGNSIITTVAGGGIGDGLPATAAGLNGPSEVAMDAAGDLFIADSNNNVIREVDQATGVITTIAGNGTGGYSGDGGQATAAELNDPCGIVLDATGDLFIADSGNNVVREVDLATGVITTVAGNGTGGYSGDGGQATAAELNCPWGVVLDATGDLFIADSNNNAVREVDLATGVITTVAGNGTGGYSGDGGPATAAELNCPSDVALDSAGNLFIADYNNSVIREVTGVNGANPQITTVAGNYDDGGGYGGDDGPATGAALSSPTGIALDTTGDLFIVDNGNNVIREVTDVSGANPQITTVAGNYNDGAGYSGDGGPATAAELNNPNGIALDSVGDLFIADTGNNVIREMVLPTTTIIVDQADTTTSISVPTGPVSFGQPVTLTATVAAVAPGAGTPTGTVDFIDTTDNMDLGTASLSDGSATLSTSFLAVGTDTIAALYSGDASFNATGSTPASTSVSTSIQVSPAALIITANSNSKVYGAALPALTASYSGFVNGDTAASLTTAPTLSTTATAASQVGGYTITASGAADPDYCISYVAGTLTVTPAALTITANNQTKVYGAALPALTASYSGFVNGDTVASLTTAPTLSTTATAASQVGGYTITASGAADPDYTISYVAGTLTVTPAALTITANNQTKVYGAALPALTAGYSGFVNGDTSTSLTTKPTLTTTATAASQVGSYTITASGATDADYSISYVAGTLTITPAPLTVTANNVSKVYGAPNPTFSVTYAGFVNGNGGATGRHARLHHGGDEH